MEKSRHSEFLTLFMAHQKALYSYVLSLVCNVNDADDLMQESVIYLWDHFDDYRPGTSFFAWARTVSRYKIYQHFDKVKKDPYMLPDDLLESIERDMVERVTLLDDKYKALQECLEKLPDDQRQLIQHKYAKGVSINEIAKMMGNSANALYKRIARIHYMLVQCVNRTIKDMETI